MSVVNPEDLFPQRVVVTDRHPLEGFCGYDHRSDDLDKAGANQRFGKVVFKQAQTGPAINVSQEKQALLFAFGQGLFYRAKGLVSVTGTTKVSIQDSNIRVQLLEALFLS